MREQNKVILDYLQLDWKLISAAFLLSIIGVLLIMSAQYHADTDYERLYYQRQLIWLAIAVVWFVSLIHLPMRLYDFGAYLLYAVMVISLVLVLIVGSARMGASRWFSFGPINFAPSDMAKIAVLLALSRFLAYTKLPPSSKRRLAFTFAIVALPIALILRQPDLGTSLVFPIILIGLWLWSGLSLWYLLLILSPIVSLVAASHWLSWAVYLVVLFVFLFMLRPGLVFGVASVVANLAFGTITPFFWSRLADYQKQRIMIFLDPGSDPRGAGYQIIQSKIAIGSGGILGKGFLNGSQSRLDFLPERHTDFVFSVLGEEMGLWGAALVLVLFSYIFYRSIVIAGRCRSRFASNVVAGSVAILVFQFIVNIGMTLGFMPVTGLALPFLSYGGTSLVMTWTLIGLIVLADYHWQEY
ncbi:MAG: rod shape-determining protein RodA [Candidatus Zixiibacteriota bacterium]